MKEEITKSYAIKRIAELTTENDILRKDVKFLKNEYQIRINTYKEYYEKQLAEKDKEIEEFHFKERNIFPMVENLEEKVNQDKITFCVEQINKTVKLAKEILGYEKVIDYFCRQRFEEEVEEQIKELKENKC